jgi:ribosomal protein S27AE
MSFIAAIPNCFYDNTISHRNQGKSSRLLNRPGMVCRYSGQKIAWQTHKRRGYRMQILAQCPRCGQRWRLEAAAADRRLRCGKCSALVRVPALTEVPRATKVINEAAGELYVDDTGKLFG